MQRYMLGATVLAALVLPASYALASTISASAGTAFFETDQSCFFRDDQGKIKNSCSTPRYWTVDVPLTSYSAKTLSVYGRSASSSFGSAATTCAAIAVSNAGVLSSWSGHALLTTGSSGGNLSLGSLDPLTDGSIQFECLISASSSSFGYVSSVKGFD